ncbi:MAG TPA: hypothetical protein VK837_05655 [Longimicrobiales bacterium]|nr:hypothetical protein [Longimicrobiales bacterium]
MNRFEYVMVLISIIIGLGITHVLLGLGAIIDRRADGPPIRIGRAHPVWLAFVFVWMVQFWWWEFRFSELRSEWPMGLYFFLVAYAVALFLLAVILVPRRWEAVQDLDVYFLNRRRWFYSLLLGATGLDIVDGWLKGGSQYLIEDLGLGTWALWAVHLLAVAVGMRSRRVRTHAILAFMALVLEIVQGFVTLPVLGF